MKTATTVETILSKIVLRFKLNGSVIFVSLNKDYYKLTLANCNNVMDYAKKLRRTKNKLLKLDSSYKIGEPHFVYKFFSSLGLKFEIFLATFNQTYSLISFAAREKVIAITAMIFDKAVLIVEKEK